MISQQMQSCKETCICNSRKEKKKIFEKEMKKKKSTLMIMEGKNKEEMHVKLCLIGHFLHLPISPIFTLCAVPFLFPAAVFSFLCFFCLSLSFLCLKLYRHGSNPMGFFLLFMNSGFGNYCCCFRFLFLSIGFVS